MIFVGATFGRLRLLKNTKITGERCSPLHINSVFTPIVGDGALDVPLLSNFFNKLGRPLVACVSYFLLCDFDFVI